ncbi:MAG: Gfo/Idh/MocA family oxidoreductase [Verrucomicrobiota bacterium]
MPTNPSHDPLSTDLAIPAPSLPYRPSTPKNCHLGIGLIGAGAITESHLQAYKNAGFQVLAIASRSPERATARRDQFFPKAKVYTDYRHLLDDPAIRIADIATATAFRAPIITDALLAGKDVLSQKPLALSLQEATRLVQLAKSLGRCLAVNQNGLWSPHQAYIRAAINAQIIGEVSSVDFSVHWDHHWICGTPFEALPHLILADFAIHWFDFATHFFGDRPALQVFASTAHAPHQRALPPFLAQASVQFERGQASFTFNASTPFGQEDRTTVIGSTGTIRSVGPTLLSQKVTLHTATGSSSPSLKGCWFPDGFQGAMAELLSAIEEDREPIHSAKHNLRTLALTFAAVESAEKGLPIRLPTPLDSPHTSRQDLYPL